MLSHQLGQVDRRGHQVDRRLHHPTDELLGRAAQLVAHLAAAVRRGDDRSVGHPPPSHPGRAGEDRYQPADNGRGQRGQESGDRRARAERDVGDIHDERLGRAVAGLGARHR